MSSSLNAPPSGIRCTADLNAATIQLKPPRTSSSWLILSVVLGFNISLVALTVSSGMTPVLWLLIGVLLLFIDGVWLMSQQHRRTTHIVLDPNILDVRQSWFGAHYRIPLVDITDITHHIHRNTRGVLTLHLLDDTILIGHSSTDAQLVWLRDILLQSSSAAQQRPAQREGLPEEVPRSLSAMRSGQTPQQ